MPKSEIDQVVERVIPDTDGTFKLDCWSVTGARLLVKSAIESGVLMMPMTVEEIEKIVQGFVDSDQLVSAHRNWISNALATAIYTAMTRRKEG